MLFFSNLWENHSVIFVSFDSDFFEEIPFGFGVMFQDGVTGVDGEAFPLPPLANVFSPIGEDSVFFFRRHGAALIFDSY